MAKTAAKKPADEKSSAPKQPPGEPRDILAYVKGVGILLLLATFVVGYLRIRRHVEQQIVFRPEGPTVILKERPTWMSEALANKIIAVARPDVAHSAYDHNLLVNTAGMLKDHPDAAPWISKIKSIRRVYDKGPGDTIEIDCEFRSPIALVKYGELYSLVDNDGYLLPEQYSARDVKQILYGEGLRPIIRIIEGVAIAPPSPGSRWRGDDLAAGIELAKLLFGRPCADEVERIAVANFGGRINRADPQLVLFTRHNTQIYWGRPVNAKDFFVEVKPAQKLLYMEELVHKFGRVDARRAGVDLRFDQVIPLGSETVNGNAEYSGSLYNYNGQ